MKSIKAIPIFVIIMLVMLLIGVSYLVMHNTSQRMNTIETVPTLAPTQTVQGVPQDQILEGEVICLPHKNTNGPQTMECAFGLKTDDGENYALDAGNTSIPPYNTGERIRANGLITPIEALSSDHWQKYDVVGIFSIKDLL